VFKRRKFDELQGPGNGAAIAEVQIPVPPMDPPGSLPNRPADSGLGVPPFRPAPPKEAPIMGRAPFSSASIAPPPPSPATAPPTTMRPASMPGGRLSPTRDPAERRTLVVGRGISVQGSVQEAERLVVEGTVEATMIHATELSVSQGGVFKGEIEVEEAEVAGTVDGTCTARGTLIVRATGRLLGIARCRRLQVEDGGQISGTMEMLTDNFVSTMPSITSSVEPI
jgi:cytoskeletal protein CcmA (bactofilin family)